VVDDHQPRLDDHLVLRLLAGQEPDAGDLPVGGQAVIGGVPAVLFRERVQADAEVGPLALQLGDLGRRQRGQGQGALDLGGAPGDVAGE
jgi:hypothetical protein